MSFYYGRNHRGSAGYAMAQPSQSPEEAQTKAIIAIIILAITIIAISYLTISYNIKHDMDLQIQEFSVNQETSRMEIKITAKNTEGVKYSTIKSGDVVIVEFTELDTLNGKDVTDTLSFLIDSETKYICMRPVGASNKLYLKKAEGNWTHPSTWERIMFSIERMFIT